MDNETPGVAVREARADASKITPQDVSRISTSTTENAPTPSSSQRKASPAVEVDKKKPTKAKRKETSRKKKKTKKRKNFFSPQDSDPSLDAVDETSESSDSDDSDGSSEEDQPASSKRDRKANVRRHRNNRRKIRKDRSHSVSGFSESSSESSSDSSSDSASDHSTTRRRNRRKEAKQNDLIQTFQRQLSQIQLQLSQNQAQSYLPPPPPPPQPLSDPLGLPPPPPPPVDSRPVRILPPVGRGRRGRVSDVHDRFPRRRGLPFHDRWRSRSRGRSEERSRSRSYSRSRSRSWTRSRSYSRSNSRNKKKPAFKRVDWVWDTKLLCFRLQNTAKRTKDTRFDGYVFQVRRHFDCKGVYRHTEVDIKSKELRDCLKEIIGDVRGINLHEEVPKINPNMLFLYLDDFRKHYRMLKTTEVTGKTKKEKKQNQKLQKLKAKQLKVLLQYLREDYAEIEEQIENLVEGGIITFDLLWALWKPGTLAYTTTYGSEDDARVFKIDMAEKHSSIMSGEFYCIEGSYLEHNGKNFGYGTIGQEIPAFRGTRKITSLPCYPLKYHEKETLLRTKLIERGKKFVSLCGVHYKSYSGMAYVKKKGDVLKYNVQTSRIMIDSATFRRINPNYSSSAVRSRGRRPMDHLDFSDDDLSSFSDSLSMRRASRKDTSVKIVPETFKDGETSKVVSACDEADKSDGKEAKAKVENENDEKEEKEQGPDWTDEDYLLASPVILGFAFSEKLWLEFSVSAVSEIEWNDQAWDSLVLESETKDLIQALVKARKYHGSQTIDDVIRGKGKGLVTVLHGPPGTGKTLTAEGISEMLKCPLYAVSAGELGTDARFLETDLQRILDICHTWGAILLLDEADVFLEKRNMQDVYRNALVSVFLRQLEYFQGILFLTTNRVETFDDAFRSRIHIALRYETLDAKAKKTIFKMFINRVVAHGKIEVQDFTEEHYTLLAKEELNGREIKNVVGSAQDLALNKKEKLGMKHIRQVLDVHAKFRRDLNGGTGYDDAMRSYF